MGSRVAGKVALVTGGAGGMGAATVRMLAAEGATVVIADLAAEDGARLADEVRAAGGAAAFHPLDVTDADAWQALVAEVERDHGRLDVLVNNAGVQVRSVGIESDAREWDLVTAVNQRGVFLGMQAAIPGMVRRGGGAIVNIASIAALIGLKGSIPYQASKSAVLGLTRGAAVAYGPDAVRVNAICPGLIVTAMTQSADPDAVASITARIPLGRDGRPDEVAAAVLFLASDDASYISGIALPVDGGYVVQ